MFKSLITCFLLVAAFSATAQRAHRHNNWSRSEIGFMAGGTYYVGDLNLKHFRHFNPAAQLMYRFNIHGRLAYRLNFTYGKIEGYDSESSSAYYKNRNLSFQTDIWELASGMEISYFPFEIGNTRYRGTFYLLAELSLTRINPKTNYNGSLVELQPLGTEGQGSALSERGKYSRVQLGVPLAIGARMTLTKNIGLNIEYGVRFLFTDYLDDVGGYEYQDPAELAATNGPLAASLANRSLDQDRFGQRGNRATRDWYFFTGIGLSFRLGGKEAVRNLKRNKEKSSNIPKLHSPQHKTRLAMQISSICGVCRISLPKRTNT